jgi:hypothetical protein
MVPIALRNQPSSGAARTLPPIWRRCHVTEMMNLQAQNRLLGAAAPPPDHLCADISGLDVRLASCFITLSA